MDGNLETCDQRILFFNKVLCLSLSRRANRKHVMPLAVTAVNDFKLTTCTLLNLAVLLSCAECVLAPRPTEMALHLCPILVLI